MSNHDQPRRTTLLCVRTGRLAACALLGLAALVSAPTATVFADEPVPEEQADEKPTVEAEDVYLGNSASFSKPAEVDADAVYAAIPEYRRILDDELQPGSAAYDLLMTKASRKFYKALRSVQKSGGYDLVARAGTVSGASDVPDITADVIAKL